MLGNLLRLFLNGCGRPFRALQRGVEGQVFDQRGTVALSFAVAALPIAIGITAAVDFAGLTAGRAALQRAVDNAALSGAASYIADKAALQKVAVFTARSAFCSATAALPAGFTINASSDNIPCNTAQGANVWAGITGFQTGTPGVSDVPGCASGQTTPLVSGYTCAFAVTVTATATTNMTFAGLLGASHTLSVTATAVNPFIDLNRALSSTFTADAWNANSVWVYPLLLDDDGQPDFSLDSGARPETGACTGDPGGQGYCGFYSMIASNKYRTCTSASSPSCTLPDGTIFIEGGAVKNIHASSAVITATTPLGIALQSAAGGFQNEPKSKDRIGYNVYGYRTTTDENGDEKIVRVLPDNCTYPATVIYDTVAQTYDKNKRPLLVDSRGNWTLPTHWFYSSYLTNNQPPSQSLLKAQAILQNVRSVPEVKFDANDQNGINNPTTCDNAAAGKVVPTSFRTKYPETDLTNCSLYIAIDPTGLNSPQPDPSFNGKCFSPSATPGQKYATLSCQNYGKSSFAFFWNDMGGTAGTDDKKYDDANLVIKCAASPKIILIN